VFNFFGLIFFMRLPRFARNDNKKGDRPLFPCFEVGDSLQLQSTRLPRFARNDTLVRLPRFARLSLLEHVRNANVIHFVRSIRFVHNDTNVLHVRFPSQIQSQILNEYRIDSAFKLNLY